MNGVLSRLALMQFPLALGGLLMAIFYPAPGSPTMLIRINGQSAAAGLEWARDNDARLLGFSQGSYDPIVILSGETHAMAAVAAGFLPVAADKASCGKDVSPRGLGK